MELSVDDLDSVCIDQSSVDVLDQSVNRKGLCVCSGIYNLGPPEITNVYFLQAGGVSSLSDAFAMFPAHK